MCPIILASLIGGLSAGLGAAGSAVGAVVGGIASGVGAAAGGIGGAISGAVSGIGSAISGIGSAVGGIGGGSGLVAGGTGGGTAGGALGALGVPASLGLGGSGGGLSGAMGSIGGLLGVSGAGAVPVGYMATATGLSMIGSVVQGGVGAAQAKAQQRAQDAAIESAKQSAAYQSATLGERRGIEADIARRANDRTALAMNAAGAAAGMVMRTRGVTGNSRRRVLRDFQVARLRSEDASARGELAAGRQVVHATAGLTAQRNSRIRSMPQINPAAVGISGGFNALNQGVAGLGQILPFIS